tara:strand:- start:364 stop:708 length:345 start_codon:yes stop_codon:yes gene_type:complete
MKKLLIAFGTALLISGCSQSELQKCIDRNITLYLNLESYSLAIYSLKLDTGISVSEYKEFLSSNKLENYTNSKISTEYFTKFFDKNIQMNKVYESNKDVFNKEAVTICNIQGIY